MQLSLTYDRLGSWLIGVGDMAVDYDRLGPARVDAWDLIYDRLGARLKNVGPYAVPYA